MGHQKYQVIFNSKGILQTKLEIIKQNVADLFKLDIAQITRLFTGKPIIIKQNLDRDTAEQYRTAILKTGVQCFIRPEADSATISNVTVSPKLQAGTITCPNCHNTQEDTKICIHCGSDIRQYLDGLKTKGRVFTREAGIINDRRRFTRRLSPDRRQAIRFEEDRRSSSDRRSENATWTGKL